MTPDEAIESLINSCNEFLEIVTQLKEENAFLTDTIEKHNLGKIKDERRAILIRLEQVEKDADIATKEANKIKSEYEQKFEKVTTMLSDIKEKQTNIDSYINTESDKKIETIKQDYQKHKKNNDKALEKYIAENDEKLQIQINIYKQKQKKLILITVISVLFCIGSIIIKFL